MSKDIVSFNYAKASGIFSVPARGNLSKKVCNEIVNAWNNNTIIDDYGRLWVDTKCLHSILRTSPNVARYRLGSIYSRYKEYGKDSIYVRCDQVISLLNESIVNARSISREDFLRYSELLHSAIRDCDLARNLRAAHYESISKNLRKLKSKRMKTLDRHCDELTGEQLGQYTEFCHIRSVAVYPELAIYQENGLIVNKDTHVIITKNGINSENDLLDLCNRNYWDTSWYNKYHSFLVAINY